MKEMHSMHMFDVHLTDVYRFVRIGSTLGRNGRYIMQ